MEFYERLPKTADECRALVDNWVNAAQDVSDEPTLNLIRTRCFEVERHAKHLERMEMVEGDKGVSVWTNAPSDYDYSYTVEIDADTGLRMRYGLNKDYPLRHVRVKASHVNMQMGRYLSGLYTATTDPDNCHGLERMEA